MNPENGGIPVIDPNVRYVGVSKLREFKAEKLRTLHQTLVIQDDEKPLAVMLSYDQFLEMQNERDRIVATLDALLRRDRRDLETSITDANLGNTKPFLNIQRTLRERKSANNAMPEIAQEESDDIPGGVNSVGGAALRGSGRKGGKAS